MMAIVLTITAGAVILKNSQRRKTIKEGRHVGLDLYDLLIEAPKSPQ
jgi:hypothetical protein